MNRLPSRQVLAGMSVEGRSAILSLFATETRMDIKGLREGWIMAPPGTLKNTRRRLKRIEAAAEHFGDFIGN